MNVTISAYLRDKPSFKDDCSGLSYDAMLSKEDPFYQTSGSNIQASATSFIPSNRINLVEPQEMEKSGFVGEAGEVSYDEGLSWHPIQPINDNSNDAEIDISSFDPLDVGGGGDGRRGILRNPARLDPDGNVNNVLDCDIEEDGLAALDYLGNVAEIPGNYSEHNINKSQGGHQFQNGFAGIAENLLPEENVANPRSNQVHPDMPTINNLQGKNVFLSFKCDLTYLAFLY